MNSVLERNLKEINLEELIYKEPGLFEVILHNDDFTPMQFVIEMLEMFFGLDKTKAKSVMLEAHTKGRAVCGTYSQEIAESRIGQALEYARRCDHPLRWSMEGP